MNDKPSAIHCPECSGKGFITCPACGGQGRKKFSTDTAQRPCPSCHGTGKSVCLQCRGGKKSIKK